MNSVPIASDPFPTNSTVLRMRGLPYSVSEDEVKAFFEGYELDGEDAVVIITQGFHRGEGFVRFKTAESCTSAHQKLNRQCIGQRYIELYPSTDGAMQLALQQLRAMGEQKNFIVRLRGLPFQANEHNIEEFFGDIAGQIANVQLCCGMDGRSSGDAFVELTTQEALSAALEKNRNMLGPRYIEVFVSNVHERDVLITSARRGGRGRGFGSRWSRPQNYGPYTSAMFPTAPGGVVFQRQTSNFVVRIRGLPFETTETQIAELLSDVNIPSQGVHLVYNAQERPTGEAFVEVLTESDVVAALRHNGAIIGRRYIEVFRSSGADMSRLAGSVQQDLRYQQVPPGFAIAPNFAQQQYVQQPFFPSPYQAMPQMMPQFAQPQAFIQPGFIQQVPQFQQIPRAQVGYSWAGDLPAQFQQAGPSLEQQFQQGSVDQQQQQYQQQQAQQQQMDSQMQQQQQQQGQVVSAQSSGGGAQVLPPQQVPMQSE